MEMRNKSRDNNPTKTQNKPKANMYVVYICKSVKLVHYPKRVYFAQTCPQNPNSPERVLKIPIPQNVYDIISTNVANNC